MLAVVLGYTDYRDADRIVHLLTPDKGRISALARSARRSRKRFQGSLDTGNQIRAEMRPGRGELWNLESALLSRGLVRCRDDLLMLAQAAYACEIVGALAGRDQPEPRLYGLLDTALRVLEACTAPPTPTFRRALEAKALTFAGYTPSLEVCASCAEPLSGALAYDPAAGGALHEGCGAGARVSEAWASAIERARRTRLQDQVDTPPPRRSLWLLHDHLVWQTGSAVKSRRLLADMVETLEDADGVGLAAPQVHASLRIAIFHLPRGKLEEEETEGSLMVLINPVIEALTERRETGWEGCLSLPGLLGRVSRTEAVRYSALDAEGRPFEAVAEGFHARVVQHECDHLDGILYPMRMTDLSTLTFNEELRHDPSEAGAPEEEETRV